MIHDEETISATIPEPPDGSILVVQNGRGEYRVIWRNDAEAQKWEGPASDHWFDDDDSDPMALYQHVKYADRVWLVPAEPIAEYGR